MNKFLRSATMILVPASLLALGACVDHDYDLDKDIDMTLGIGGDHLTIPPSDTEPYTMKAILDIDDPANSSIREDEATGDYYVYQEGTESNTEIEVDRVKIKGSDPNTNFVTGTFGQVPSTGVPASVTPTIEVGGTGASTDWHVVTDPINNRINVNSEGDVPAELIEVYSADTEMEFKVNVMFMPVNYDGGYTIDRGFKIDFGRDITIKAAEPYLSVSNGSVITFTRDVPVAKGASLNMSFTVSRIDVSAPWGIQRDHTFSWQTGITSRGTISLDRAGFVPGVRPAVDVVIQTWVSKNGLVLGVDGVVDPEVKIDDSDFTINDIPDFLEEEGNHLDIVNPMIFVTVDNSSPCTAYVNLTLTSYRDNNVLASRPERLTVAPGHNVICLSREAYTGNERITENVVDPKLSELINTIPDRITYHVDQTNVKRERLHFNLGTGYALHTTNYVDFPLAFGPDMKLIYEHTDDNWDMSDMEKVNFNIVEITADVVNSIPMDFVPELIPVYLDPAMESVDVDMNESQVLAGTSAAPVTSSIKITLTGETNSLKNLNGVIYRFTGSNPPEGAMLNAKQAIQLSNVRITLRGGISYDAN